MCKVSNIYDICIYQHLYIGVKFVRNAVESSTLEEFKEKSLQYGKTIVQTYLYPCMNTGAFFSGEWMYLVIFDICSTYSYTSHNIQERFVRKYW